MRFTFNGEQYALEFKRIPREFTDPRDGLRKLSAKPYTTVNLLQFDGNGQNPAIFRTGTVGCWWRDNYSLEKGRLGAMKLMTKGNSLSKEFKQAVWLAYFNR